jgi:hypothetical protein
MWSSILSCLNETLKKNNVSGEWSVAGLWGCQPYRHLWADCLDNVRS